MMAHLLLTLQQPTQHRRQEPLMLIYLINIMEILFLNNNTLTAPHSIMWRIFDNSNNNIKDND